VPSQNPLKRRKSKQWCKRVVTRLHCDDKIFTILFGVIREDLPAYGRRGSDYAGELRNLCPVFGKMKEIPAN
jgi:hypothetical protein